MISVVLPCYNEKDTLPEAHARFTFALDKMGEPWEILVVNDGSHDASSEILKSIHQKDPRWKVINFSRNYGHQAALSCGLAHAAGDAVVLMDLDLQDPPEVLPELIAEWRNGYQVVYAIRKKRKEHFIKRALYFFFYRLLKMVSNIDIPLDSGDFCVMDRQVVDVLNRLPERNRFLRGLRAWVGFRQKGVEYERQERFGGAPKFTYRKLMGLGLDGLFSFSKLPLQLIGYAGIVISSFSFLGAVFFIMHRMLDFKIFGFSPKDVPGTATVVVSILFMGGVQLVCLSIMGEYLGRVFDEVKQRPNWVIKDSLGFGTKTASHS